jgi:hypothetical protein
VKLARQQVFGRLLLVPAVLFIPVIRTWPILFQ